MDTTAQNRSLDNDYGSTHGPNSPTSFKLALFTGDPLGGGTEVPTTTEVDVLDADGNVTGTTTTANGYARATVAHSDFAASVAGLKSTTPIQFADATAEWPDTVTHWQLYDNTGAEAWDSGAVADGGFDVTAAGPGPSVVLSIYYADSVDEPA